jgi:hypothetical protein
MQAKFQNLQLYILLFKLFIKIATMILLLLLFHFKAIFPTNHLLYDLASN